MRKALSGPQEHATFIWRGGGATSPERLSVVLPSACVRACVIQMYSRGTGTGSGRDGTQEIKYIQFRDLPDIHCLLYVTWN